MKIASWNLNSIKARKSHLIDFLKSYKPNILMLQELKCEDKNFPKEEIEDLGYNLAISGQKTFNGVAILSLHPIEEKIIDFQGNSLIDQARYIETIISINKVIIRVGSVYVPNGENMTSDKYQNKLKFLDEFILHCSKLIKLDEKVIIGGDFNIAPEDIDTYAPEEMNDSVLFNIEVRNKFRSILNLGYCNAVKLHNNNFQLFSWWDYRAGAWHRNQGMLLDHILLSPEAADLFKKAEILKDIRGLEKASDHAPIMCELNL